MVLGYLGAGIVAGTFAFVVSLLLGSSVLVALSAYCGVGNLAVLGLALWNDAKARARRSACIRRVPGRAGRHA